jgi:uncharacterized membrane-anchored protein
MITPATSSEPLPEPDPGTVGDTPEALALFDSYRRLADVFHDVLSEQTLDALLERIADTLAELIPHDDLAIYEADETTAQLWGVFARGAYADEVIADEPFRFGSGASYDQIVRFDHGRDIGARRHQHDARTGVSTDGDDVTGL